MGRFTYSLFPFLHLAYEANTIHFLSFTAPPPGMSAPGTVPPLGMQQANQHQPGRPGGFPPNFQPPANMPNINFSAPVIRLGTTGPAKPPGALEGRERNSESTAPTGRRAGVGAGNVEAQRQSIRDAMLQLQPPSKDEVFRTIFVGGITEGTGGDEGVERILRSAGNLRRWIRATDADDKPCKFGFAEYDDPESLEVAVEIFQEVEVPIKHQIPSPGGRQAEVEKSKLLVMVDESSLSYLEQHRATSDDQDPSERQARLDSARQSLATILSDLSYPMAPTQKEEQSTVDRDGDSSMQDTDRKNEGGSAEVVTIPINAEDELSDIPAEMRESVAKEIAAFRERSNRRDIERMKREEEIEALERSRYAGSRVSRLASPPLSAPTGPAGGANGVPLGPRDRTVPSGPKGFGAQIPKDYQKGVSFVNGTGTPAWPDQDDEETDASDEELERRKREKKATEQEKQFLDQERRWLNRERSRTAAVERERNRDKAEEAKAEEAKEAMAKQLREWSDDVEATRKLEDYYADRGAWIRSRAAFRSREIKLDESDRTAEEREKARMAQQREQARGMADDFLDRQAKELESRITVPTPEAPREPQRFKLSLGAAAQQKAQAAVTRRSVAEVEGLLEDEEEATATTKRTLIPIKFDSTAEASGLSDEERAQVARQLAAEIPSDKDGLWAWDVKWEFVDESVFGDQLKPFVEKKIMEYLGIQEQMLVDVVEEHIRNHGKPQELVELLAEAGYPNFFFFSFLSFPPLSFMRFVIQPVLNIGLTDVIFLR